MSEFKTASLDYEAEYYRLLEEIEKAKYEIDILCERLHETEQAARDLKVMQYVLNLIFAGEITNG